MVILISFISVGVSPFAVPQCLSAIFLFLFSLSADLSILLVFQNSLFYHFCFIYTSFISSLYYFLANLSAATRENSIEVPQKSKNRTTTWSSNSIPGYLSKENKKTNSKRYIHPYVHCSIIHNSQNCQQPKCLSMDEWMKMRCIYIDLYI